MVLDTSYGKTGRLEFGWVVGKRGFWVGLALEARDGRWANWMEGNVGLVWASICLSALGASRTTISPFDINSRLTPGCYVRRSKMRSRYVHQYRDKRSLCPIV